MLTVISGTDSLLLSKKTKERLESQNIVSDTVSYIDNPSIDILRESVAAQDLFGNISTFVFRELNDEVYDFLFLNIESFSQSQNIFIAQVSKVLKKQKDICEKIGVEIIEIKVAKEREMPSFMQMLFYVGTKKAHS